MGRGGATTSVRGYRSKISLDFQSIDFCSLVQPRILNVRKTAASVPEMDCSLEVNFENKTLLAWFPLEAKSSKGTYIKAYRFIADLANLKVFHKCHGAENEFALVVPMPFPPKYWWSTESKALKVGENSSRKLRKAPKESWFRATNMEPDCDSVMMYPVASSSEAHDSDFSEIGRWTTFRFFFREPREDTKSLLREMSLGLEDLNIDMKLCDNFKLQYGQHQTMWTFLDRPANASDTAKFLLDAVHLPFEVRYQLEVCVSSGIVNEHNVSEAFLRQLAEMEPKAARLILENIADSGRPITDPLSLFHNSETKSYITPGVIPTSSAMVRKIFITPTTIKLNTPVSEVSNRVVRKFSHNQDRFLRVQFTEESGRGLPSMSRKQDEEITRRVLRALHQGIRIGDRVYHFLAYGNSQLRERGAYFFAPTNNVSCDDIRGWLGSFDHIRIVAKYAARIGQCFSTSREVQGIRVPVICNVPDIGKDGHCFTDGVGMVSELLTSIISGEFCLDASIPSSAFQFRMGGCKGMLVKWPLKARGKEVHIRKSQEKFPADSKTLEILRCARFATATLNRQTIVILECLGVPPSAFMNLLQIQLKAFDEAMIDSARAAKLLLRFVDDNHITPVLAKLLEAGFKTESGLREPFVVNAIALWRLWSLKQLKEKARIHVEKSVFLLGCVDETKTLRGHHKVTEGSCDKDLGLLPEIFVQMTGFEGGQETRIYEGVCIVGRNPSLHPGDIRVVCAVDVPELHHLKDVVVFPRIGDRPVPNMLAGGDLDGDDFFVIWDPKLIPKEWNHPPMDYQAPEPDELDRDVRVDDLKNFFVKYMQNDFLALIAISHLALADKEGPKSRRCIELAHLHSKAVDYPKTGQPAKWSVDRQPSLWPHFMEKRNSYRSRKSLGLIYDRVVGIPTKFQPDWENGFDQRILNRYELSIDLLEKAREVKFQYDVSVRRFLAQHSLDTEFELWTGFAMSRPAVGSDYKRQEDLGREYNALKQRFRDICYKIAGGAEFKLLGPFVAAVYKVTEGEVKDALSQHDPESIASGLDPQTMPLISFPWVFHGTMMRIALGRG